MVDNFYKIGSMLKWNSDDEFYFLQILRRKKDLPEEIKGSNKSARLIKSYYINNLAHLNAIKEEVIGLCEVFNARAGINLNKRSYKKCALQTVRTILDQIDNQNNRSARRAFNTVCGKYTIGSDKHWILDYDEGSLSLDQKDHIRFELNKALPVGDKIIDFIPTKQGTHIITKPFDLRFAKEILDNYELDVHKNNPTVLFIP